MIFKEININNKIISEKYEIGIIFNEYFSNIGPTLANKIPCVVGDHLEFIKNLAGVSMFIMPTDESSESL